MENHQLQVKAYGNYEIADIVFVTPDGVLKTIIKNERGVSSWQILDPDNDKNIVSRTIKLRVLAEVKGKIKTIDADMKILFLSVFPDRILPNKIICMQKYLKMYSRSNQDSAALNFNSNQYRQVRRQPEQKYFDF